MIIQAKVGAEICQAQSVEGRRLTDYLFFETKVKNGKVERLVQNKPAFGRIQLMRRRTYRKVVDEGEDKLPSF